LYSRAVLKRRWSSQVPNKTPYFTRTKNTQQQRKKKTYTIITGKEVLQPAPVNSLRLRLSQWATRRARNFRSKWLRPLWIFNVLPALMRWH